MNLFKYFLFFIFLCNLSVYAQEKTPPLVVESIIIAPEKLVIERKYIGRITTENFSVLKPEVSSIVSKINVVAAQEVKMGHVLFELNSASQARDLGLVKKNVLLLEKEFARKKTLHNSNDISQAELDKLERELLSAKEKFESSSRALSKHQIVAPFDGIVGVPRVVLGQSVNVATDMISIMRPPYSLTFKIPASRLGEVLVGQKILANSEETQISAVEKSIDEKTRMGFAKAVFNRCKSCIVGSSVSASLTVLQKDNVLLLPSTAIFYKSKIPHVVLVVNNKAGETVAEIRSITVGDEQDGRVEVLAGLKAGDQVVLANPKRLHQDAALKVAN